ncbi:hypothetical protein [Xanthobacter sp. VNH20]|uniref:hypothetical protein n=1 Tax=Xanthobacter sp. VNH20 TaxID=3156616 RepID=UPI0032B4B75E
MLVRDSRSTTKDRLARFAPLATIVLLSAAVFIVILLNRIDWPIIDDFSLIIWHKGYAEGNTTLLNMLKFTNGSHPLGLLAIISAISFELFGISITPLILMSVVCIVVSASLLWFAFGIQRDDGLSPIFIAAAFVPILFHPTQIKHLMWGFELSWFMILLALAACVFLVERGGRWVALSPLIAAAACLSSAHGIVVLPCLALHLWLKRDAPYRWPLIAVCALASGVAAVSLARLSEQSAARAPDLITLLSVYAGVVGGAFGFKGHGLSISLGVLLLACCLFIGIHVVRSLRTLTPVDRVATVLIAGSLMMVAAFTAGRSAYGLVWALGTFHAAPMMAPMLLAIFVWFLIVGCARRPALSIAAVVFVLASTLTSLPYAVSEARAMLARQQIALLISCDRGQLAEFSSAVNFGTDAYAASMRRAMVPLHPLCGQPVPQQIQEMVRFPDLYRTMIAADPRAEMPLRSIWEFYIMSPDLQRMFGSSGEERAMRLLDWATTQAKVGHIFHLDYQKSGEEYFKSR